MAFWARLKCGLLWFALVLAATHLLAGEVVINEIMYHPPDDRDELQYVELFNQGNQPADLAGWSLNKGLKFTFAKPTVVPAGGYLVVCRDRTAFASHYGSEINVVGIATGRLKHGGERLELTDAQGLVVDAVKYDDREPWPIGPDGYSASLERISPSAPGDTPDNWAPSKLPAARRAAGTPGRQNDSFSANLPPVIGRVEFAVPALGEPAPVSVSVTAADDVKSVSLLYAALGRGETRAGEANEKEITCERVSGDARSGTYRAAIPPQPEHRLVRFRLRAVDAGGAVRLQPSENEPRPTHSYYVLANTNTTGLACVHLLQLGPQEQRGASLRTRPPRGQRAEPGTPTQGNGAFIYLPTKGRPVQTFDHIRLTPRQGGWKVRLHKDRPLNGMTTLNVFFEYQPRWVLAEHLAYELYRKAGVPAPLSGHVRVWHNHRPLGYHLYVEQPNSSFLRRIGRDDSGNLYKLLWYGNGLVGQHEKKTNLRTGHDDLTKIVEQLQRTAGDEQWQLIQQHFNVEEFINYFAVNMCIQNWDGFFNNYFVYHDLKPGGKWEIYPWDEDKTWGDYDGGSRDYDWHAMPLTIGMNTDQPSRDLRSLFQGGPFGGTSWWRPPGWFSGPLLANPEFRKRFLARLKEVCETVFTEEKMLPVIIALERRLKPEVEFRAQALGQDPQGALKEFSQHMESFRRQLVNRRKFILNEVAKAK